MATLGGMLALLVGGARRLGKGGRLDDLGRRLQRAALVLLAIPALVGAILVVNGSNAAETVILLVVAGAWFYGLALIAADFLGLLALALRGRGAEETGALLPFYLFAVGLLVYLPIFLLGALRVGGCFR